MYSTWSKLTALLKFEPSAKSTLRVSLVDFFILGSFLLLRRFWPSAIGIAREKAWMVVPDIDYVNNCIHVYVLDWNTKSVCLAFMINPQVTGWQFIHFTSLSYDHREIFVFVIIWVQNICDAMKDFAETALNRTQCHFTVRYDPARLLTRCFMSSWMLWDVFF